MSLKLSPGSLAWYSGSFIICPSLSFQHEFSTSLFHDNSATGKKNNTRENQSHQLLTNPLRFSLPDPQGQT